jgi:hypothetical protein
VEWEVEVMIKKDNGGWTMVVDSYRDGSRQDLGLAGLMVLIVRPFTEEGHL